MEHKLGKLFPLPNTQFTFGELASGYMAVKVTDGEREFYLRFTPAVLQEAIQSALDNKEDFEQEVKNDCGLTGWIKEIIDIVK